MLPMQNNISQDNDSIFLCCQPGEIIQKLLLYTRPTISSLRISLCQKNRCQSVSESAVDFSICTEETKTESFLQPEETARKLFTPSGNMSMFPWLRLICHTDVGLHSAHFDPGAAPSFSSRSRGLVVARVLNVHSLRSWFLQTPQRKQHSPASQPPALRRQAGEIPA